MTANHSRHSLKKSYGAKSDGSDSLLDIKRGKEVKNCKKHGENYESFRVNCSFFESERANQEQIRAKEQRAKEQTPNPVLLILLYSNIDDLLHIMDAVTIIAVYCVYCVVLLKFFIMRS